MSSFGSESVNSDVDNVNLIRLPALSRKTYLQAYDHFITWKNERALNTFSEDVMLAYFEDLAKSKRPPSLYSTYSMLKCTLLVQNDINIDDYRKLKGYLKATAKGYVSKKSKVFSNSHVESFLKEAPDSEFLVAKAILIFAIQGSCGSREIVSIKVDDIEKHSEQLLLVNLKDTNGKLCRTFIIRGEYKDIVDKYISLRPKDVPTDRLFIRYKNGKCIKEPISVPGVCAVPAQIAAYLKLPDPKSYTGSSFRKTSAALLPSSGVDLIDFRRREETEISSKVYVADPFENITDVTSDSKLNGLTVCDIKVEIAPSSPIWSGSPSPQPCESEHEGRQPSPPLQKKRRVHKLKAGRIEITENVNNTKATKTISIPGKSTTITFKNCTNVSNINISL